MQLSGFMESVVENVEAPCIANGLWGSATKIGFVKGGLSVFVSFLHDTSEKGFLRAFAVPLEYASVRLFVCSPNAFTSD
jgi:hypothetical protein